MMTNTETTNPANQATAKEVIMTAASSLSANWDLVVSCLHHSGALRERLTADQRQWVRRAADGFGTITGRDSLSLDALWDWSHVRDSSEQAVARMALVLREMLKT